MMDSLFKGINDLLSNERLVPFLLAFSTTVGLLGVMAILSFHEVPEGSREVIFVLVGSLGAGWTGIVGYYYGSSSGSAKKSEIMAKSTEKLEDAQIETLEKK